MAETPNGRETYDFGDAAWRASLSTAKASAAGASIAALRGMFSKGAVNVPDAALDMGMKFGLTGAVFFATRNLVTQPLSQSLLPHPAPDSLLRDLHPSCAAGFFTGFLLNGVGRGVTYGIRGGLFLSGFAGLTQLTYNWKYGLVSDDGKDRGILTFLGFSRLSEVEELRFREDMMKGGVAERKSWWHVRPKDNKDGQQK